MNEKMDPFNLSAELTLKELTEVTQELLQDALDVVSRSRTLKQKTSDVLYSGPLVRDLLLSWVLLATGARARLLYWMETSEYANGLQVRTIGMSYTLGSQLAMELISAMPNVMVFTDLLASEYELVGYKTLLVMPD